MLKPISTSQFERDRKKALKQGKNFDVLEKVLKKLLAEDPLEPKYRDHPLKGHWKGCRDCHVQNDWVLIYRINSQDKTITFERLGSNSELFK